MTRNRAIPPMSDADRAFAQGLVICENDTVLGLNKPAGLPSQMRRFHGRNVDDLLWAFARSNGKRPRLVHRLDTGTSGIMLAAKTAPGAADLSRQFAAREVRKSYVALISGDLPDGDEGEIAVSIARPPRGERGPPRLGTPDGKPALTRWRILSRTDGAASIALYPRTGRLHQLRLHMAHIGCPILGDETYGGGQAPRMMLHAMGITFVAPGAELPTVWSAPVPDAMKTAAQARGLTLSMAQRGGAV